jgi:hypothetical protein
MRELLILPVQNYDQQFDPELLEIIDDQSSVDRPQIILHLKEILTTLRTTYFVPQIVPTLNKDPLRRVPVIQKIGKASSHQQIEIAKGINYSDGKWVKTQIPKIENVFAHIHNVRFHAFGECLTGVIGIDNEVRAIEGENGIEEHVSFKFRNAYIIGLFGDVYRIGHPANSPNYPTNPDYYDVSELKNLWHNFCVMLPDK